MQWRMDDWRGGGGGTGGGGFRYIFSKDDKNINSVCTCMTPYSTEYIVQTNFHLKFKLFIS